MASNNNHQASDTAVVERLPVVDAATPESSESSADSDDSAPKSFISAAAYRAGVDIDLDQGKGKPGGRWIHLRPRSLNTMVRTKRLPNSLIGAANRMLANAGRAQQNPNAPQDPKVGEGQLELQDYLVTQLVASFKVVMEADYTGADDEVCVSDMMDADKNLIAQYAMQGQKALESFRQ